MDAGSPEQRLGDAGVLWQDFRAERPHVRAVVETTADAAPKVKPPLALLRFEAIEPCLDANDFVQGILTRQSYPADY